MSDFVKRNARARRVSMHKWARGLRYGGYVGGMLTGAASLWFFAAVVLS